MEKGRDGRQDSELLKRVIQPYTQGRERIVEEGGLTKRVRRRKAPSHECRYEMKRLQRNTARDEGVKKRGREGERGGGREGGRK
jgi:hypothetical protein